MDILVGDGPGFRVHRENDGSFSAAPTRGDTAPEASTRQLGQRSAQAHTVPLGKPSRHREDIVINGHRGPHPDIVASSHQDMRESVSVRRVPRRCLEIARGIRRGQPLRGASEGSGRILASGAHFRGRGFRRVAQLTGVRVGEPPCYFLRPVRYEQPFRRPFDAADRLAINTLRGLAVDAVENANSGHPGLPLGAAPMAWVLWSRFLRHAPSDPAWPDRDRFVLSAGHGSMLLYGLLHLFGYGVSLDDLRRFRKWKSRTPGHPESFATRGVEATTGPLGQGAGNSVGMAIAERALREEFPDLTDHRTYALVSDGDLMEGVAHEAASLAGQLRLSRLTWLYDANDVTLDGPASLAFDQEDVTKRHEALGWHVQTVKDGDRDLEALEVALRSAAGDDRPSLIRIETTIGFGAPTKAGKSASHGAPLGADEARETKQALDLDPRAEFVVPDLVRERVAECLAIGETSREEWLGRRSAVPTKVARELGRRIRGRLPRDWDADLPAFERGASVATRSASGEVMNRLAARIPEFFGGDADLSSSTKTVLKSSGSFSMHDGSGRNIHYGVREHAMGAAANGIAYHRGFRTFTATFFCFADYMRPSIRLAALSGLPTVHVFTHDSIGVGEDGPTHQPVEHLMSLRAMPNLHVVRPADANETVEAWRHALTRTTGPTALVLTRQNVPVVTDPGLARGLHRGGYVLAGEWDPDVVLIATGSEVALALEARRRLGRDRIKARVVSLPCWELFEEAGAEHRNAVLPPGIPRVSVEAGATLGWERHVASGTILGVDRFGGSAPGPVVARRLGLTAKKVEAAARELLE